MSEEKLTKKERLDYLLAYVRELKQMPDKRHTELNDALNTIQEELSIKHFSKPTVSYYPPFQDFNSLPVDARGTWCNTDTKNNYEIQG